MVENPRATDEESAVTGGSVGAEEPATTDAATTTGPDSQNSADRDIERGELVDLGSLALRLPAGARPRVTGTPGSASHALYLRVPEGHISVSVLAAPADRPLWPEFAEAISSAVQGGEGSVLTEEGEWGTEVQSGSGGELTWYIGRDGPLWLLYGTATGPAEYSARLASSVRALLGDAEVRRGHESLPDKTTLPLRLPPGYAEPTEPQGERSRTGRAGDRSIGPAVATGAAATGAAATGAAASEAAGSREPELKPLPGPPPASWHPSYHGTSSIGPQQPDRPAPPPVAAPPEVDGPRPPGRPVESGWPEWLDDPLAPAPDERAAEPRTRDGSRGPKTRTLIIAAALILLIAGAGAVASLTRAVDVSPRPAVSDAQSAASGPRPDDQPSQIGPPAVPVTPGTPPAAGAQLPGLLGPPVPGNSPGTAPPAGSNSGGSAVAAPPSGSSSGHGSTGDFSPGHPSTGGSAHRRSGSDSAHVAHAPAQKRSGSRGVGTRSSGGTLEATDDRSQRRSGPSAANTGRRDRQDGDSHDGDDDEGCDCDDNRSPRRSSDGGPLRHRSGVMTAGRDHGPLLGLLDTALGGL